MADDWTIEHACREAWPAERTTRVGDWLVAQSGDASRRINSASPATQDARLDDATLDAIEARFVATRPVFRIPDFLPDTDSFLTRVGYAAPETPTYTLARPLTASAPSDVMLADRPTAAWLAARERLTDLIESRHVDHAGAIARLVHPAAFASLADHGALAYAARIGDVIVIEAVATDPAHQRRGLARRCIAALLAWGADRGAATAALQVRADNAPALALYRGMGFIHRYGYHYRRRGG